MTIPSAAMGGPSSAVQYIGRPACRSIATMITPKAMFMIAIYQTIGR
jgi:hypothetical protein